MNKKIAAIPAIWILYLHDHIVISVIFLIDYSAQAGSLLWGLEFLLKQWV